MRTLVLPFIAMMSATGITAEPGPASHAVNELGVDLHHRLAKDPKANLCVAPYSIQTALAMTYAGADGETQEEMAKVLHYGSAETIHDSFKSLRDALAGSVEKTEAIATASKQRGGPSEPITLAVANRLFGSQQFPARQEYLDFVAKTYSAPLEALDFQKAAEASRKHINGWVEEQTRQRIRDLIAPGVIDARTRLVLVNALYMKAPWATTFPEGATKPEPFHIAGGEAKDVPTMKLKRQFGYAKREGYTAVSVPYSGGELHFLVILPDKVDGLPALEKRLTAADLEACAKMEQEDAILELPKFKLEPPGIPLGTELQALGMKTAFDKPPGSANFERMFPRRPDEYLYISEVVHKTFLALDEKGTEAAAATAVIMVTRSAAIKPTKPIEVKVDRPFLFAIQHAPTGTCLFLGRVADPR